MGENMLKQSQKLNTLTDWEKRKQKEKQELLRSMQLVTLLVGFVFSLVYSLILGLLGANPIITFVYCFAETIWVCFVCTLFYILDC